MSNASQYVPAIRNELEKLARAGQVTYYKDLGAIVGKPPRWTLWKEVLDEISYTKPDVTIIVLQANSGWPGQIDYSATNGKPTPAQKKFAQDELEKVFKAYCPGKPGPQLPIKR
jgi:ABC-type Zn uptake system ZnuABC Zn-binding protein ZnuA